jgi:DNA-binding response OmpR family regulator
MASNLLKGKQILAVDDEQDLLDHLREVLDEHGVEFDSVSAYEEAIQRLASLTYDLVVLDIMGVRGFELLECASAKQIPVIMRTAHALSPK